MSPQKYSVFSDYFSVFQSVHTFSYLFSSMEPSTRQCVSACFFASLLCTYLIDRISVLSAGIYLSVSISLSLCLLVRTYLFITINLFTTSVFITNISIPCGSMTRQYGRKPKRHTRLSITNAFHVCISRAQVLDSLDVIRFLLLHSKSHILWLCLSSSVNYSNTWD